MKSRLAIKRAKQFITLQKKSDLFICQVASLGLAKLDTEQVDHVQPVVLTRLTLV